MAKMKDDHFELVVNIQRFIPEEVKVYLDGQAVIVMAKHESSEGYVTGFFPIYIQDIFYKLRASRCRLNNLRIKI